MPVIEVSKVPLIVFHFPCTKELLKSLLNIWVHYKALNRVSIVRNVLDDSVLDVHEDWNEVVWPVFQLVQGYIVIFDQLM
jgi:hypothetical protein